MSKLEHAKLFQLFWSQSTIFPGDEIVFSSFISFFSEGWSGFGFLNFCYQICLLILFTVHILDVLLLLLSANK